MSTEHGSAPSETLMSNVGTPDRIMRTIVGLALIVAPFVVGWSTLALATSVFAGLVLIGTAATSFCPIYAALRLSSKGSRHVENH